MATNFCTSTTRSVASDTVQTVQSEILYQIRSETDPLCFHHTNDLNDAIYSLYRFIKNDSSDVCTFDIYHKSLLVSSFKAIYQNGLYLINKDNKIKLGS